MAAATPTRRTANVLALLMLPLAILAFSPAPPALAQTSTPTSTPTFSTYIGVAIGDPCPSDTEPSATIVGSPFGGTFDGTYCVPAGFVVVTDQTTCDLAGAPARWVDQGTLPAVCAYNGWVNLTAAPCPAPTVAGEGEVLPGLVTTSCLFQLLVANTNTHVSAGTAVCIESAIVAEGAPDAVVGTQFVGNDGNHYLVHGGPPSCTVNCHAGFDFDCDEKLGDFCPAGIDRTTVAGIHQCLAALQPTNSQSSTTPAVATTLAHTGTETTVFSSIGLGLIGFGATTLGLRRRWV